MAESGKGDEPKGDGVAGGKPLSTSEWLIEMMKKSMKITDSEKKPEQKLEQLNLDGVAKFIADGKCKKIITMAGAGISTSAGIPDFRSPGTGLYDNLQEYNLPSPQAIFELEFFKENPEPFFKLAKALWPGIFKPTPSHYFIKTLEEKSLLVRHYTQNIDTLERVAGLDEDRIVEAHGTFHKSHCISCHKEYSQDWIREKIFADEVPRCEDTDCGKFVKPDIVFFGEKLPDRFFDCVTNDLKECDLLIIMGTSLVVQPFASLTNRVPDTTPRLYINLEKPSGSGDPMLAMFGMGHGFQFDMEDNYRDVFWEGTCDDGCQALADKIGWGGELKTLVENEHKRIDSEADQKSTDKGAKM